MRKLSALIGVLMAFGILAVTLLNSGAEVALFINLMGIIIVVGGSLSAIFLSYSLEEVSKIISIASAIFLKEEKKFDVVAKELLDFSQKCMVNGVPSEKQKIVHPFLDDCIMIINEKYTDDETRKVLEQRINSMYDSEIYDMSMLRSMAKYPPAFGMIGTVIGLITLMGSIGGGDAGASNIGAYMAIALTTTLYGLVLSNFLFKPISDNLENSSIQKMKMRSMIMEVCIDIKAKRPLVVVQDTINSLIPPKYAIEDTYLEKVMNRAA
jgi:chemotaxis protein MotA